MKLSYNVDELCLLGKVITYTYVGICLIWILPIIVSSLFIVFIVGIIQFIWKILRILLGIEKEKKNEN